MRYIRCKAESRYAGSALDILMTETYQFCSELSPLLDEAIEQGDMQEIKDIRWVAGWGISGSVKWCVCGRDGKEG